MNIAISEQEAAGFCQRHQIKRLAFFGSVLTEDFGADSDVDVLIDFEPDAVVGFFRFAEIQDELSELLGRKVDLNTPGFLSPHFRTDVIEQAEVVYG